MRLAAIAFAGLQGRADSEIHLIPVGYVGEVTIVFRAANGESVARESWTDCSTLATSGD
jgi:hypothetical protein